MMAKIVCGKCSLSLLNNCCGGVGSITSRLFIITDVNAYGKDQKNIITLINHSDIDAKNVYITSLIKGREEPSLPESIKCIDSFLEKELSNGNPDIVATMGGKALGYLAGISNIEKGLSKKYIRVVDRLFIVVAMRSIIDLSKKNAFEYIKTFNRINKYLSIYKNK